jgi:hypothetical protein
MSRDSAIEAGLGWLLAAALLASVGAIALIKHPRAARGGGGTAGPPAPLPPSPPPPISAPPPLIVPPPHVTAPDIGPHEFSAGVMQWLPYLEQTIGMAGVDADGQPIIPIRFMLSWLAEESDGNECSIGAPWEQANGLPLESGLWQFMAPHDIAWAGTTIAAERQNCAAVPYVSAADGAEYVTLRRIPAAKRTAAQASRFAELDAQMQRARAIAQTRVAPLTEDQKLARVASGVRYVAATMQLVDGAFAKHGAKPWSKRDNDYWRLIKSRQSGAGIPVGGLDAATAALGGVPANWAEFKRGIWASSIGHQLDIGLSNAERAGARAFPVHQAGV